MEVNLISKNISTFTGKTKASEKTQRTIDPGCGKTSLSQDVVQINKLEKTTPLAGVKMFLSENCRLQYNKRLCEKLGCEPAEEWMLKKKKTKEILELLIKMGAQNKECNLNWIVRDMLDLDIKAASKIFDLTNLEKPFQQHQHIGYYSNDFMDMVKALKYTGNKNTQMILKNSGEFLSIYNKCLNESTSRACNAFGATKETMVSKRQPMPLYGNPILELAKNSQQKEELNSALAEITSTIRNCSYDKELQDSTLSKNLEDALKKNNLISQNSSVTFTKLNRPQETLRGLCYRITMEDEDGGKIIDDAVLKVYKYTQEDVSRQHGLLPEIKAAKFIEEMSGVDIGESDCIRVYGGDLSAGYILSRFASDELGKIKYEIDFEKLGLEYTDEKEANRIAGRLVDYGGFYIQKNNQLWDKWVEKNFR